MRLRSISTQLVVDICHKAADTTSAVPWGSLLTPAAAIVIGAVGWAIVERFARERERRAEVRQMVDTLGDAIAELQTSAESFYALHGADIQAATLATTIRVKVKTLFDLIDAMCRSGLTLNAEEELKRFRQALTGGEFDSKTREPAHPGAAILVNITATGQQLNRIIRLSYFESYVAKVKKR